nr:phosphomevalonate kinase-like isoform X2 [Cherax quadricarinatus]
MIAGVKQNVLKTRVFFIRAAIDMYEGSKYPIWIVSDMRRQSDLAWFQQHYDNIIYTVRITASEAARKQRGWTFTSGVDDAESECDLDNITDWNQEGWH